MDLSDTFGSDYSRIGFQKTMSIHFEEIKSDQELIKEKTTEIRKSFAALVKREKEFEGKKRQAEGEGSVQDWGQMESLQAWVIDEEMALASAQSEYSQERQDLIGCIKVWAQDCANQLAKFPGYNVETRRKRAVDFVNLMKKFLRATTPLGDDEEEGEEDKRWLAHKETELPKAKEDTRQLRDRLRERGDKGKRVHSPSVASKSFASSTPEILRESKKGEKGEEPRSNLLEMGAEKEAEAEAEAEVDAEGEAEGDSSGCPVTKETTPHHICVDFKADGKKDEDTDDEPTGPNYERVKVEKAHQSLTKVDEREAKKGGDKEIKEGKEEGQEDKDADLSLGRESMRLSIVENQLG